MTTRGVRVAPIPDDLQLADHLADCEETNDLCSDDTCCNELFTAGAAGATEETLWGCGAQKLACLFHEYGGIAEGVDEGIEEGGKSGCVTGERFSVRSCSIEY